MSPDPFLSRSETAAWLGITPSDPTYPLLGHAIDAATQACIDEMQGDPRSNTYTEWQSGTGGSALGLNNGPITAVASVIVNNLPIELQYITFDGRLLYNQKTWWPRGPRNVLVTYTAGLDDLPSAVRQAALYTVKAMWLARRVDMNATGESFGGVLSQSFWVSGPGSLPPSAASLLRPYQKKIIAA